GFLILPVNLQGFLDASGRSHLKAVLTQNDTEQRPTAAWPSDHQNAGLLDRVCNRVGLSRLMLSALRKGVLTCFDHASVLLRRRGYSIKESFQTGVAWNSSYPTNSEAVTKWEFG